jgi:hypothetical protein
LKLAGIALRKLVRNRQSVVEKRNCVLEFSTRTFHVKRSPARLHASEASGSAAAEHSVNNELIRCRFVRANGSQIADGFSKSVDICWGIRPERFT